MNVSTRDDELLDLKLEVERLENELIDREDLEAALLKKIKKLEEK